MTTKKQDYDNQYYKNNKERIAERKKLYRQNNKDKILEQEKISRDKNKDKRLEIDAQYYKNNKERINERKNIKYTCPCGSCLRKGGKAEHEKTKKHIKFLESQ